MMEETHHFVLSRFERTRNSLERILTILFFLEERGHIKGHLSQIIVIFLTLGETLPQQRDRCWDIALAIFVNS
jgi:hypothetical protein